MAKNISVKTGKPAPVSGLYHFPGRYTEIALSKGDRVPPNTKGHQQRVTLVRPTKGGN
jgi:hypothetical protein